MSQPAAHLPTLEPLSLNGALLLKVVHTPMCVCVGGGSMIHRLITLEMCLWHSGVLAVYMRSGESDRLDLCI